MAFGGKNQDGRRYNNVIYFMEYCGMFEIKSLPLSELRTQPYQELCFVLISWFRNVNRCWIYFKVCKSMTVALVSHQKSRMRCYATI